MAEIIIPEGFAKVTFVFGGAALPHGAQVTFGVDYNVGADLSTGAQYVGNWYNNIRPLQSSAVQLQMVRIKFGPNQTGGVIEEPDSNTGALGGTVLPPNCTMLVQKRTALGGRMNRGRFFWPGVVESVVDNAGTVDAGTMGTWNTAMAAFLAELSNDFTPMVVLHTNPALAPTPVTSLKCQGVIGTQRRRVRG